MSEHESSTLLLRASDLEIWRGEAPLFSGVGLTLAQGEALFIAGRNGSGKSTLLRTLCGLGRPQRGHIDWLGGDDRAPLQQELLFIGHHNGLRDAMSALENLAFYQGLAGVPTDEETLYAALARFAIAELAEQPVRLLSQGQRRRVSLCRLLLAPRRRLWVLDEPYTSLDKSSIVLLDGLIGEHLDAGGAAIITSHHSGVPGYPSRTLDLD